MMRAVHFNGDRIAFRTDCSVPKPDEDEVRIRVLLAGICSTDLEIIKGYFGFQGILGHEMVGVVDSAADPDWVGRRVVSSINFAPAGTRVTPGFGLEHLKNRQVLGILNRDGAMADWVAVPQQNLFLVPDSVTEQEAVLTEPLAAALRIAARSI
jgi:threonine dehydrogenase-like Zn-dependent dehydrogenase